jgi:ketosteroid isomerase-like protein
MSQIAVEVTAELLQSFVDAWNRHDVDALMSFMADACAFEASAASGQPS